MKIGFTGTVSVGKTTLVNELSKLPEFKEYTFATERSKYLRDLGIPLNTDSTLKGQLVFASERSAELMQENIITDRTVVDVMAFAELSESMDSAHKHYLNATLYYLIKEYDILFYVSPEGVEIEDNGVGREAASKKEHIHKKNKKSRGLEVTLQRLQSIHNNEIENNFVNAGITVFSNSNAFRMNEKIPLVVPLVNYNNVYVPVKLLICKSVPNALATLIRITLKSMFAFFHPSAPSYLGHDVKFLSKYNPLPFPPASKSSKSGRSL